MGAKQSRKTSIKNNVYPSKSIKTSTINFHSHQRTPYGNLVEAFLIQNDIPYERKFLDVLKGEGQTPEFLKISPLGKIPAIVEDDGFSLTESGAIIKYLCNTRNIKDSMYPQDAQKRARVDAYYDYIASNYDFIVLKYTQIMQMKQTDKIEEATKQITDILNKITNRFIKDKKFAASDDEPTIGDFTTAYAIGMARTMVKVLPVPKELEGYLDRVNAAFPQIKKQVQSNVQAIIQTMIEMGVAKAEDFQE